MSDPPIQPSGSPPLHAHNRDAVDRWLRQREEPRNAFYPRVVAILLAATGFVLLTHSVTLGFAARETLTWATTTGMIYGASSRNALGTQRGFYEPQVRYAYSVGAQRLEGTKISNADLPIWTEGETQAFLDTHTAGTVVNIHYDPARPEDAVLQKGIPPTLWRIVVPSLAFLIFGSAMLIRTGRQE